MKWLTWQNYSQMPPKASTLNKKAAQQALKAAKAKQKQAGYTLAAANKERAAAEKILGKGK